MTRSQALSRKNEEQVDLYDVWNRLIYQYRVEKFDDTPVQIRITEILYSQRIDGLCK